MTNTWYPSDWDQAYRPSYAKIRRTVVRHMQVHLYQYSVPKLKTPSITQSWGKTVNLLEIFKYMYLLS